MAQYFQVLSQGDKAAEELRKIYPGEEPAVQYVIAPEEQAFQGQQVNS